MAVTFDALGPSSAGAGGLNQSAPLSWSHTNAGNCLIVGVAVGAIPSTSITTPVTYNGVAMTSVARILSGASGNGHVEMFYLLNPSVGTFNVVVTPSAAADLEAGSLSFSGVVSLGTPVTASSNGTSGSAVVATSTGNMVVDLLAQGSGATQTSTQTQRWMKVQSGGTAAGDAGQATASSTGSNVTMSWTWAASDSYGIIAVELLSTAATAPPGIFIRGLGTAQAAVNTGTASISTTPTLPAGTSAGDRVFIVTHNSPATTTPTTPTNWTLVSSQSLGTGTLGATAGPRLTTVWYRDYDGVWTMPSVVLPSVAAPAMLTQSISLGITGGRFAVPASGFGSDVTVTTTPYSATCGSVVPFGAGDMALVTIVGPGLSTMSGEGLTATGATFDTVTEQWDAASSGATNGIHGGLLTTPVTAGSATAAAVATGTVSTSGQSAGGSIFIRQAAVFADLIHHDRARFRASLW